MFNAQKAKENAKLYIDKIQEILELHPEMREEQITDLYTVQKTFETLLNIIEQDKKDLLLYRDHLHTSKCEICGKEFNHKRMRVRWCEKCREKAGYERYKLKKLSEKGK